MRIAHVSDLHFGHHDIEVASGLRADLVSQRPDLVAVSGDFTQRGTPGEFRMAHDFLASLQLPVFSVPGNHDLGRNLFRRFLDPYRLYRQHIATEIEPFGVFRANGATVALAGLNTTRRALADRDWSHGSVNPGQLEMLGHSFGRAEEGAVRVVVAHHPLMRPTGPTLAPTREVRRAGLALEAMAQLGVRLVLSGHFHLSFVRRYEQDTVRDGVPPGPRRAAAAPILVCQASTAISDRRRGEPNSYNLIDIDGEQIEIRVRHWGEGRWMTRERDVAPVAGA